MSSTWILPRSIHLIINVNNIVTQLQTSNVTIGWAWGHCAKYKSHTCDWKSDHQAHEQGAINLINKIYWFAPPFELTATVSHTTGMVWVIFIFATNHLCVAWLFLFQSGTFCIWTSVHGPAPRENLATFSLSWVFTLRLSSSVNFHGTHIVWHMLFFLWEPHRCWTQWQLIFEINFCAFCNVKPKSAKEWQEIIL